MYSDRERILFKSLGLEHLMQNLSPPALYRAAVEKAFFENMDGIKVDVLRKAAKAVLCDGHPNRKTPEFEKLLEF